MAKKKNVIITGAAGLVGTILRQHWGNRYSLRLADIRPVENLQANEEFVQLNITDLDAFTAACQDMDVLVHLAADRSPKADFYESLLNLNIIGGYNGFEAARRAACQRIVFASSINAVLGYQGTETVSWDVPVFPRMSTVPPSVLARPSAESTPTSTACPASVCAWVVRASTRGAIGTRKYPRIGSVRAIRRSSLPAVSMWRRSMWPSCPVSRVTKRAGRT